MIRSESVAGLMPALLKAKRSIGVIAKDKTAKVPTKSGGSYSYSYADLEGVLGEVEPKLHDAGLVIVQSCEVEDGRPCLVTYLWHESGEFIGSRLPLNPSADAQALGSELTYKRRYALYGLLSLKCSDDDGAAATHHHREPERQPRAEQHVPPHQPPTRPAPSGNGPRKFSDDVKDATGEGNGFWEAIHHLHKWAVARRLVANKATRPGEKIRELDDAAREHGDDLFAELNAYAGDAGAPEIGGRV